MRDYLTKILNKIRKDRELLMIGFFVVGIVLSINIILRLNQQKLWFDDFSIFINKTLYTQEPITENQKTFLVKNANEKYTGDYLEQELKDIDKLTKIQASKKIERLKDPERFSKPYRLSTDIRSKIITNTYIYVFFIFLVIMASWYYGGQKSFVLISIILSLTYFFYDIISLFSFSFFIQGSSVLLFFLILYLIPVESPIDRREEIIKEYEASIRGYGEKVHNLKMYIEELKKDTSNKEQILAMLEAEKQQALTDRDEAIKKKEEMQDDKLIKRLEKKIDKMMGSKSTIEDQSKFPYNLPAGTKWENIIIKFLDDENVFIDAGKYKHDTNYKEMGFIGKGKNPEPSVHWRFLKVLSTMNGEIKCSDPEAKDQFKKQKETLAKRLKSYFSIDYDPFYPYKSSSEKAGNSYRIKITLIPADSFKQTIDPKNINKNGCLDDLEDYFNEMTPSVME